MLQAQQGVLTVPNTTYIDIDLCSPPPFILVMTTDFEVGYCEAVRACEHNSNKRNEWLCNTQS